MKMPELIRIFGVEAPVIDPMPDETHNNRLFLGFAILISLNVLILSALATFFALLYRLV
jgi:hypothetical protein